MSIQANIPCYDSTDYYVSLFGSKAEPHFERKESNDTPFDCHGGYKARGCIRWDESEKLPEFAPKLYRVSTRSDNLDHWWPVLDPVDKQRQGVGYN